jgi:hypothetical protein
MTSRVPVPHVCAGNARSCAQGRPRTERYGFYPLLSRIRKVRAFRSTSDRLQICHPQAQRLSRQSPYYEGNRASPTRPTNLKIECWCRLRDSNPRPPDYKFAQTESWPATILDKLLILLNSTRPYCVTPVAVVTTEHSRVPQISHRGLIVIRCPGPQRPVPETLDRDLRRTPCISRRPHLGCRPCHLLRMGVCRKTNTSLLLWLHRSTPTLPLGQRLRRSSVNRHPG